MFRCKLSVSGRVFVAAQRGVGLCLEATFSWEKRNSGLKFFGFDCGFGLESPGNNKSLNQHLHKWWFHFFVYSISPLLAT